jgi:hypothetical protein
MEKDLEKELKELGSDVECPKDFKCYKQGLQNLCKAKDDGIQLQCIEDEEEASRCAFSVPYGDVFFCICPLRVHICKKLGK